MLLAVAAALLSSSAAPQAMQSTSSAQARATIRIVASTRLRVGAERSEDGRPLRLITIRGEDGSLVPAKVVEFE